MESFTKFLVDFGEETLSVSSLSHTETQHLKHFYNLLEPELLILLKHQVGENITVEFYFQRKTCGFFPPPSPLKSDGTQVSMIISLDENDWEISGLRSNTSVSGP